MTIDIVACTDNRYVMPTGVMMHSVCVNNQDVDIAFHVLIDETVSQKDMDDLRYTIEKFSYKRVTFYNIESRLTQGFPLKLGYLTLAAYYRLFLTDIISPSINKVLYLDSDIIVRHSLVPLWETDISDYAIGATIDSGAGDIRFYNQLEYPSELGYFNSGMLLINLDYWRSNNVKDLFFQYIPEHSKVIASDQDVLNALFCRKKKWLPITFNLQTGFFRDPPVYELLKYQKEVDEARVDPVVVHFVINKPWINTYEEYGLPYKSTFLKYKEQTIWKDCKDINRWTFRRKVTAFVGNLLRKCGLRPPKKYNIYPAPID